MEDKQPDSSLSWLPDGGIKSYWLSERLESLAVFKRRLKTHLFVMHLSERTLLGVDKVISEPNFEGWCFSKYGKGTYLALREAAADSSIITSLGGGGTCAHDGQVIHKAVRGAATATAAPGTLPPAYVEEETGQQWLGGRWQGGSATKTAASLLPLIRAFNQSPYSYPTLVLNFIYNAVNGVHTGSGGDEPECDTWGTLVKAELDYHLGRNSFVLPPAYFCDLAYK
ncbi:hypothetical protein NFI96_023878, partial [Prochilodus magdalenae]